MKTKRCSPLEIIFALIKIFIEFSQMLPRNRFLQKGGKQLTSKFSLGAPSAALQ